MYNLLVTKDEPMICDQDQFKLDRNEVIKTGDLSLFRDFLKRYGRTIKPGETEEQALDRFRQQPVWQD